MDVMAVSHLVRLSPFIGSDLFATYPNHAPIIASADPAATLVGVHFRHESAVSP